MEGAQELQAVCLLLAANTQAKSARSGNRSLRSLRSLHANIKCVAYMLVAFALRRRNLGRRDLRPAASKPLRSLLSTVSQAVSDRLTRLDAWIIPLVFPIPLKWSPVAAK